MKQIIVILLSIVTTLTCHAADVIVDGVNYTWSSDYNGYIVTGWDEDDPREELHILGEVEGLDVIVIQAGAFIDNTTIVSAVIDEGITRIGQNAFNRCSSMKLVTLPEGLTTIEEEAFAYCTGLTTIVIPSTVNDIQSHAFMYCTSVTDVYFLMTTQAQLDGFDWWDGLYHDAPQEAGGLEFNQSRLRNPDSGTRIHVPQGTLGIYKNSGKLEAWLLQEHDNSYPLWWIVNYGTVGNTYTVSDDLSGIYSDINGHLYAKDDNRWLVPDIAKAGEIDYMATTGLMTKRSNVYDQSNWVKLQAANQAQLAALKGYTINGGTISGKLIDKTNPSIELSEDCEPVKGNQAAYVPNTYIAASFMSRTQVGADGSTYAFVRPKPQEMAFIDWLVYSESEDGFYLPSPESGSNNKELKGGFKADLSLIENPPAPALVDCAIYSYNAIIRHSGTAAEEPSAAAPRRASATFTPYVDGDMSSKFTVFPLSLPDDPILTGIDSIVNDATAPRSWYSIEGCHLGIERPTTAGIYIFGGKKIIVY